MCEMPYFFNLLNEHNKKHVIDNVSVVWPVKNLSKQTKFKKTVKCTNCGGAEGFNDVEVDFSEEIVLNNFLAGLADPEIQRELVNKENLTLEMAVQYTADQEWAKRSGREVKKEDTPGPELKSKNDNLEYKSTIFY